MNKSKHSRPPNKRKITIHILVTALSIIIIGYTTFVFLPIPFVRYWRNIYIETAMTTATHKWLATYFIPSNIINSVMDVQTSTVAGVHGIQINPAAEGTDFNANSQKEEPSQTLKTPTQTEIPAKAQNQDILNQKNINVGDINEYGDTVLVNDIDEGIVIYEVKTTGYTAHLALIADPARVKIATTLQKGLDNNEPHGEFLCDFLTENNAILGINANGFADKEGHGKGGYISGLTCSNGELWGTYNDNFVSFGFDEENRLLVGNIEDWNSYNIRDGAQFKPALIIDGQDVTSGSNGWGLQPRSCIGQAENGTVLMLVVDGRQVGYSIGATVGDCADILKRYGAVNACCCDGGSSSVMAYNGQLITTPSTSMKTTGRWLPNAFIVTKKSYS